jgi:hypothetical protein
VPTNNSCMNAWLALDGSARSGSVAIVLRKAAIRRQRGSAGSRVEQPRPLGVEVAPVASVCSVGRGAGLAGSASSAGRTWAVLAAWWMARSLDRLTPTPSGKTAGTSSATMRFGNYSCCKKEALMSMVGGLDLHRGQITFDVANTDTGEVWRGRIWQPDRLRFRR